MILMIFRINPFPSILSPRFYITKKTSKQNTQFVYFSFTTLYTFYYLKKKQTLLYCLKQFSIGANSKDPSRSLPEFGTIFTKSVFLEKKNIYKKIDLIVMCGNPL